MHPFEFILLFFSFIYTVALTHILFAATRMIRHRRQLVFSWPHALWMLSTLLFLSANWLSLWDLREIPTFSLEVIVSNFALVIGQYFVSALVAPDFENGDGYDLREFHRHERRTYLGAYIALMAICILVNLEAAIRFGLGSWGQQNLIGFPILAAVLAAFFIDRRWVQIAAPLAVVCLLLIYPILYYPALK